MKEWFQRFYYIVLYAWYGLYAVALLGIVTVAPAYLETLNEVLKYLIIGFLLVRFRANPNEARKFTEFDRTIVFSAAFFLLASTAVVSLVENKLHLPNAH
jgi:uncharacterized membrane protein SirB2